MTYRSKPERKGYRLTEEGENLYSDWIDMGGCYCHTGCAPCRTCTFEGHPISLEETDEVWEPELVFPKMTPFKSIYEEWLGRNKDKSFAQQIAETEGGGMARDKIVNKSSMKDPPEFKVGKWYKCGHDLGGFQSPNFSVGEYYKLRKIQGQLLFEGVDSYVRQDYFDVNSECAYDLSRKIGTPENIIKASNHVHTGFTGSKVTTYHPADVKIFRDGQEMQLDWGVVKESKSNSINQQEESKMSNSNNRRVLTVQVFDLDPALDVELSLVHVFKDVVTEDTNEVTLTELLHTGQLVEPLALHNKKRVAQDNKDILSRTGKKVKLEAIKVKNLSFKYI